MKLEIKVDKMGAELQSVIVNGKERMHDGKTYWNRHAPNLFPIVGELKNGKTIINGQTYEMTRHGFAREMNFEERKVSDHIYEYILKDNEETLQKYPFHFTLLIRYEIKGNTLEVTYQVENNDDKEMLFGIGAHPAFRIEIEKEEYELEFEQEEKDMTFKKLKDGLVSDELFENILEENKKIKITKDLFLEDALIIEKMRSNKITLNNKTKNQKELTFDFTGFTHMGIWAKPGAPFVCIEPWYTTADKINHTGYLKDKEGIITVKPNEKFECKYAVEFF